MISNMPDIWSSRKALKMFHLWKVYRSECINGCPAHAETGLTICAYNVKMNLWFARVHVKKRLRSTHWKNVAVEMVTRCLSGAFAYEYFIADGDEVNISDDSNSRKKINLIKAVFVHFSNEKINHFPVWGRHYPTNQEPESWAFAKFRPCTIDRKIEIIEKFCRSRV